MSSQDETDTPPKNDHRNGAALLWGTSDEVSYLLCVVNSDRAAETLQELTSRHFPSEIAAQLFEACRCLYASKTQIVPDTLADEMARRGYSEAAQIARTDLAKMPKRPPKSWAEKAAQIAEVLIENGPILFSTDSALDNALGEIEWLWNGFIPFGFVTGLVGEQDGGKSTVAQGFARLLLEGGIWPDGQQATKLPSNQKLLWLDTDGNIALFHQKLKSWNMPRGRFIFPADPLQELSIDNPRDWRWIEAAIAEFRPPLVVIDALSGSHSGKENDTDSMKVVMKRLHNLAQKHKIAVVVIHHLNKSPFGVAPYPLSIDRLRGSSSISQFCRSILALTTPDANAPDARRLDVIKLNVAKKPPAVGYVLTDDGPAWGTAPEPPKERRAVDDAIDFLQAALGEGLRPSDEVEEEAKARNIGSSALKNARKILGVKPHREGGKDGKWFLTMPKN
jgi:hypothetical protein